MRTQKKARRAIDAKTVEDSGQQIESEKNQARPGQIRSAFSSTDMRGKKWTVNIVLLRYKLNDYRREERVESSIRLRQLRPATKVAVERHAMPVVPRCSLSERSQHACMVWYISRDALGGQL